MASIHHTPSPRSRSVDIDELVASGKVRIKRYLEMDRPRYSTKPAHYAGGEFVR
jgi:hypothetical protein